MLATTHQLLNYMYTRAILGTPRQYSISIYESKTHQPEDENTCIPYNNKLIITTNLLNDINEGFKVVQFFKSFSEKFCNIRKRNSY